MSQRGLCDITHSELSMNHIPPHKTSPAARMTTSIRGCAGPKTSATKKRGTAFVK